MDLGVVAGFIAIAVVVYFLLYAKPAAVFVVEVRNGAATAKQGKVTDALLREVTEQCATAGVLSGELRGLPRGPRISLTFSKDFPPELQQRLRNWWAVHGWLATARRAR